MISTEKLTTVLREKATTSVALFTLMLLAAFEPMQAQTFLNGSFEKNMATQDQINLTNSEYNFLMGDSYAFGDCPVTPGPGNMDIITSADYCNGGAEHGDWYVAFTQGGTDAISLTLSATLVAGNEYTISFYNKGCYSSPQPFEIGLSAFEDEFGTLIYAAPLATEVWTKHTFTFTAPINGIYITVQLGGPSDCYKYWAMVDHFEMDDCQLEIDLGKDSKLCTGETLLLDATTPGTIYLWQDGSTDSTFEVTKPGIYWVQATNHCKSVRDSIVVSYYPELAIDLADTVVCEGETITLDASTPNVTYLWQNGSTAPTFKVMEPGIFWIQLTDNCGSLIDTVRVDHKPVPKVNLGSNGAICPNDTLVLNAFVDGANYLWHDNSNEATVSITEPGVYWVELELDNCHNTDSIRFEFKGCEVALQLPNVFTPNGDGINDFFEPMKIIGIEEVTILVYNRWGQKLFESPTASNGWSGKANGLDCSVGTYFWKANYRDIYQKEHAISGSLTLIR